LRRVDPGLRFFPVRTPSEQAGNAKRLHEVSVFLRSFESTFTSAYTRPVLTAMALGTVVAKIMVKDNPKSGAMCTHRTIRSDNG